MIATLIPVLIGAGFFAVGPPALETARDQQDRPALQKMAGEYLAAADKAPNDADVQYRAALASSYLAEVALEVRDKKQAEEAAERGGEGLDAIVFIQVD